MDPQKLATILDTLMVEPNVYDASTVKDYIDLAVESNPPKTYDDVLFNRCFSTDAVWDELEETFELNGFLGDEPEDEDGSELIVDVVIEYLGLN